MSTVAVPDVGSGYLEISEKGFGFLRTPEAHFHPKPTDVFVTPDTIKKAFQEYGVHGEVRVYPDADHAFFNDTRPEVYNAPAAQDAWTRTMGLFSRTLKS